MSALGQKQTCAVQNGMSALPPKADIRSAPAHVCFGPEADIASLIDDLVGAGEQRRWEGKSERFCGLEVDRQRAHAIFAHVAQGHHRALRPLLC